MKQEEINILYDLMERLFNDDNTFSKCEKDTLLIKYSAYEVTEVEENPIPPCTFSEKGVLTLIPHKFTDFKDIISMLECEGA